MMKLHSGTRKAFRPKSLKGAAARARKRRRLLQAARGTEGSQLLEFALCLPMLLVFLVGIVQFAGAFTLKQKMANAAREGARIMVSNILADSSCATSDCSVQATTAAVANYMTSAGVDSSCLQSAAASTGTSTWTLSCPSGISLTINNQYYYTTSTGEPETGTEVTLTYPYTWFFNNIIGLMVPGASMSLPKTLTETAVMQNIVN